MRVTTLWISALLFLTVTAIGPAVPNLMNLVEDLGRYVPQSNASTGYVQALVWATLIGFSIPFWTVPAQHKLDLIIAWLRVPFKTQ